MDLASKLAASGRVSNLKLGLTPCPASNFTLIAAQWAVTPIHGGQGARVGGFIPGNPTDRRFAGTLSYF